MGYNFSLPEIKVLDPSQWVENAYVSRKRAIDENRMNKADAWAEEDRSNALTDRLDKIAREKEDREYELKQRGVQEKLQKLQMNKQYLNLSTDILMDVDTSSPETFKESMYTALDRGRAVDKYFGLDDEEINMIQKTILQKFGTPEAVRRRQMELKGKPSSVPGQIGSDVGKGFITQEQGDQFLQGKQGDNLTNVSRGGTVIDKSGNVIYQDPRQPAGRQQQVPEDLAIIQNFMGQGATEEEAIEKLRVMKGRVRPEEIFSQQLAEKTKQDDAMERAQSEAEGKAGYLSSDEEDFGGLSREEWITNRAQEIYSGVPAGKKQQARQQIESATVKPAKEKPYVNPNTGERIVKKDGKWVQITAPKTQQNAKQAQPVEQPPPSQQGGSRFQPATFQKKNLRGESAEYESGAGYIDSSNDPAAVVYRKLSGIVSSLKAKGAEQAAIDEAQQLLFRMGRLAMKNGKLTKEEQAEVDKAKKILGK